MLDGPRRFVVRMDGWRRELGLSNAAFARYLGLSPSYWSRIRRGEKPLTMGVVDRVLQERPELQYYLAEGRDVA